MVPCAWHAEEKAKYLTVKQRIAVAKLARSDLGASGTEVRRVALERFSPNSRVQAGMVRSVRKIVQHSKKQTHAAVSFGIALNDTYVSIAALGNKLWFGDMRKHNDHADDFHFSDPHEVICIGNVAEEDSNHELYINLTTIWFILNLARGLISGWPNTLCGDGTGKFSKKQATMISLGIMPFQQNTTC